MHVSCPLAPKHDTHRGSQDGPTLVNPTRCCHNHSQHRQAWLREPTHPVSALPACLFS